MRVFSVFVLIILTGFNAFTQPCINEFLSSNINNILDEDHEHHDWIEIFNNGINVQDMAGYSISDDKNFPAQWIFPAITIPPGKHLLLYASGKDRYTYPYTFKTIINWGDIWRYKVPSSDLGESWFSESYDDTTWNLGKSGFGYADDDDSTLLDSAISVFVRKKFDVTNLSDIHRLILSIDYDDGFVAYINGIEVARENLGNAGEITPFNQTTGIDHEALLWQGGYPSNFEINPGVLHEGINTLAIQCHNISATSSDLTLIPFLTIGRFTPGMQELSPFLSITGGVSLHTNFKLDVDGEGIYLFNASGVLIDSVSALLMHSDVSFGRKPDGTTNWNFFAEPTPGDSNSTNGVFEYQANPVIFNPTGGKQSGGVNISLSTTNPLDSIYYTTDGSDPDKNDLLYTGTIYLASTGVIKARVIKFNTIPGPVGCNTYVTELNHDIPVLCLSTEPANLWDENYGIYAYGPNPGEYPYFGANFWQDWECPVHVELYDTEGIKKIDQLAGTKIFGGWSRASEQKSMALFARKIYGKGSFNYQLFKDKPITSFESFIIRNSGNDNLGLQFHDCFLTGLTRRMNIDRQAFQPAAVYINGQYHGLLNIREKISKNYLAENHFVNPDSVNLLDGGGTILEGSNEGYNALLNFLNSNSSLSDNSLYNTVLEEIDVDNFIQYQLSQIYFNNTDWPGNNIKYWNTTAPDSKWRWILYDTDFGYGIWEPTDYTSNTLVFATEPNGPDWPNPPWSTLMLRRLLTNHSFRNNFITQYCDRLNLDFSHAMIMADLDSLQALYDQEIVYTFNRWWGSYDEWLGRIHNRRVFGLYRPEYCRMHMQDLFSLGNELTLNIDVSDKSMGRVKLNTICPKDYPFYGIYFQDIPVKLTAVPRAGYKFVRWEGTINSTESSITYNMSASGNFKAVFSEATTADIDIVINEINYVSPPYRDTKDWVELYNNGSATVDLNSWLLSDTGPEEGFSFGEGTIIAPGDYLVICRDLENFRNYNPSITNSIGNMIFGLSSNGDELRLYDNEQRLHDAVDYYIFNPWPENVAQSGSSIVLIDPSYDNSLGQNWQAANIGGTPGRANFPVDIPVIKPKALSSDLACFPNPFKDYTTIEFNVSLAGEYYLEVTDLNGRSINMLYSGFLDEGTYSMDWDGSTTDGNILNNGIYIARLISQNVMESIKIIMLK